jgi:MFS family permease
VFFGIGNFAGASYFVLGPLVAKQSLGGAGAGATIVSAFGIGTVIGGFVALRLRPRRPLLASCVAAIPYGIPMLAIALDLPVPALVTVSAVAGAGIAVHLGLWFTVFQQQVPEHARSRVSSYDALGSFVLLPFPVEFLRLVSLRRRTPADAPGWPRAAHREAVRRLGSPTTAD